MAFDPNQTERRLAEWSPPRFAPVPFFLRESWWSRHSGWMLGVTFLLFGSLILFWGEPWRAALVLLCVAVYAGGQVLGAKYGANSPEGSWLVPAAQSLIDSLPSATEGMIARIGLHVDGHVYGKDVGEITLTDGWLVFEGCRTDFALAPHDCVKYRALPPVEYKSRAEICIAGLDAEVRILISATESKDSVAGMLHEWTLREVTGPSISVLPPLKVAAEPTHDPGLRVARFSGAIASLAGCAIALVAFQSWLRGPPNADALYIVVFGLTGNLPGLLTQGLRNRRIRIGRAAALKRLATCRQRILDAQPPKTLPNPMLDGFTPRIPEIRSAEGSLTPL